MNIVFSVHSKERILQRGIEKETVKYILNNPDFIKKSFDGRFIAIKRIDKLWEVVFKKEKDKIIVISVYFS